MGRVGGKPIAYATIAGLFASTLVPVWASLTPSDPPLISKIIDGVLALLLAGLLAVLYARVSGEVSVETQARSFRACQWLAVLPLLLFVTYTAGVKLKWDVLLIGLGWRSWYLVTVLPFLLTVLGRAP